MQNGRGRVTRAHAPTYRAPDGRVIQGRALTLRAREQRDRRGTLFNLAVFLIQTEELGGSIARSLKVYASTMRQKRKQRAEEAARKMVIKLLFPLALFIMPALLLVVLGPPAINIMRMFGNFTGK